MSRALILCALITLAAVAILTALSARPQDQPANPAPPADAPTYITMVGECPMFSATSPDGALTLTIACAPGASPLAPSETEAQP